MSIFLQASFAILCAIAATPAMAGPPVPVPEPVSLSLLAIGVGGAAIVRGLRKRRK
jgi:hypothetical protein